LPGFSSFVDASTTLHAEELLPGEQHRFIHGLLRMVLAGLTFNLQAIMFRSEVHRQELLSMIESMSRP
jgi:hypothetical protein